MFSFVCDSPLRPNEQKAWATAVLDLYGEKGQAPERLWNSVCESCDGPGKLLLCNYCNLAWHPHCAASKNDDWGQDTEGGTGFVCPACILDIDATEHNPPDCALQEPFRIGEWA